VRVCQTAQARTMGKLKFPCSDASALNIDSSKYKKLYEAD